jgi:hypothetical protein
MVYKVLYATQIFILKTRIQRYYRLTYVLRVHNFQVKELPSANRTPIFKNCFTKYYYYYLSILEGLPRLEEPHFIYFLQC